MTEKEDQTVKTYYITDTYDNKLPIEFVYSKNPKYIVFQYCRATCDGYLDGETEVHASFIQRDNYCDSLVWYANVVPPDDNRKYEFIGTKIHWCGMLTLYHLMITENMNLLVQKEISEFGSLM